MRSMMAAISAAVAMGAANAVANTWYVSPEGGGDGSDREHPTDAQTAFKALRDLCEFCYNTPCMKYNWRIIDSVLRDRLDYAGADFSGGVQIAPIRDFVNRC